MDNEQLEKKRAYNREYANRPDVKAARVEYRRQWRAKRKAEDPEYWRKEVASKESIAAAQKRYKRKNRKILSEKSREVYYNNREKKLGYQKTYRARKKAEDPEYFKKEIKKNDALKIKARSIANQIQLDSKCKICSATNNLERHHEDYNQPKIFITLCRKCHAKERRKY